MSHPGLVAVCTAGGLLVGLIGAEIARRHGSDTDDDRPLIGDWSRDTGALRLDSAAAAMAVTGAMLWGAAVARFGASLELPPFLVLFSGLLVLAVVDARTYRLPNRLTLPLLAVSIPLLAAVAVARGEPGRLGGAAVGAIGVFVFLGALAALSAEWLGWGDVKLGAVLGLYLGWLDPVLVVWALLFAGLVGVVVGLAVLAVRRRNLPYPFGPWLALGTVAAVLASNSLLH